MSRVYKKWFDMKKMGVPLQAIKNKMSVLAPELNADAIDDDVQPMIGDPEGQVHAFLSLRFFRVAFSSPCFFESTHFRAPRKRKPSLNCPLVLHPWLFSVQACSPSRLFFIHAYSRFLFVFMLPFVRIYLNPAQKCLELVRMHPLRVPKLF